MKYLAYLTTCAAAVAFARADDELRLVFLGDVRPVLISVQAEIDGKPVREAWSGYLRKWFDLLDRDNDGSLDAAEAKNAPSDDLLWQTLRQGLFFARPGTLPARFAIGDGKVHFEDFLRYYEKKVGPYQFESTPTSTASTSAALLAWLDADRNTLLTREEVARAVETMDVVDKIDDELITTDELAANPSSAFANGQVAVFANMSAPAQTTGNDSLVFANDPAKLALLLLAHYDRDKGKSVDESEIGLAKDAFKKLDANNDGKLDLLELARWLERWPDVHFTVRIGRLNNPQQPRVSRVGMEVRQTDAGLVAELGDAEITVRADGAAAGRAMVNRSQVFLQQFKAADKDNQGFIKKQDVQGRLAIFSAIFPLADANDDSKMTEQELRGFLALQESAYDHFATVSVSEQGRAFFQIIDANRDNRLSLRELRSAWSRLEAHDSNKDGAISTKEIARQFQLSVQRGQGVMLVRSAFFAPRGATPPPAPTAASGAPLWFRKMDLNNDGDVSPREFLGTHEQFRRIDADGDGLLDPHEAARAK